MELEVLGSLGRSDHHDVLLPIELSTGIHYIARSTMYKEQSNLPHPCMCIVLADDVVTSDSISV
jgi:hypothetical protein